MTIPTNPAWFQGHISLQQHPGAIQPWRLPHDQADLFPSIDNALMTQASLTSGVRLRLRTNASSLTLRFDPLAEPSAFLPHAIDLVIDNRLVTTRAIPDHADSVRFDDLPPGETTIELWLPVGAPMIVHGIDLPAGASLAPAADPRFHWLTYGSSLTHCRRAYSPAQSWPAVVARARTWRLTNLGFGGNCCLEPNVARLIRDRSADFISLKLGINVVTGHLSARTFPAAVMGMICIIREKHPVTPLAVFSPIAYPPNESTPNAVGYTIERMRTDIQNVVDTLRRRGDTNLFYGDGLRLCNVDQLNACSIDQCHPNADGILDMAARFLDVLPSVVPGLPG